MTYALPEKVPVTTGVRQRSVGMILGVVGVMLDCITVGTNRLVKLLTFESGVAFLLLCLRGVMHRRGVRRN